MNTGTVYRNSGDEGKSFNTGVPKGNYAVVALGGSVGEDLN